MASSPVEIVIEEVHLNNATELISYAALTVENNCVSFDPHMKEPIDVSKLERDVMYTLMAAFADGDKVEICTPKHNTRDLQIEGRKWNWKKIIRGVIAIVKGVKDVMGGIAEGK